MSLKKYFLNKLNFHIQKYNENAKEESIVKTEGLIHDTAEVISSEIAGKISIGEHTKVQNAKIYGNVNIGNFTRINGPNTNIFAEVNKISIGNFCSIARNVDIQEWYHHTDRLSTHPILRNYLSEPAINEMTSKGDIIIENDVWIGAQSVILSGTKIGNGAIIGANSVVTKDIPPFAIVAGNPTRIIKYRFDQNTIGEILKLKWWEWDKNKLKRNKRIFNENFSHQKLKNFETK